MMIKRRNHTSAHSVTIQPIKLILLISTFCDTLVRNHIIAVTQAKNLTGAQLVNISALDTLI